MGDDGRYLDDGRIPAELVGLPRSRASRTSQKKRTSAANIGVLKEARRRPARSSPSSVTRTATRTAGARRRRSSSGPSTSGSSSLDKAGSRPEPLRGSGDRAAVGWIPAWGEARIRGAVESRPDWCISRQRAWGVPIPAFYDADKRAFLDAGVVRAIADKVARLGTNLWYDASPAAILEGVAPARRLAGPRRRCRAAATRSTSGSTRARPTRPCCAGARAAPPGPRTSTWRAATSTAAGSSPRCGPASSPSATRPTGPSSPTASSWTRTRRKSPRAPPTKSRRPATPTSRTTAPTSSGCGSRPRTFGTTSRSRRRSSPMSAKPTG